MSNRLNNKTFKGRPKPIKLEYRKYEEPLSRIVVKLALAGGVIFAVYYNWSDVAKLSTTVPALLEIKNVPISKTASVIAETPKAQIVATEVDFEVRSTPPGGDIFVNRKATNLKTPAWVKLKADSTTQITVQLAGYKKCFAMVESSKGKYNCLLKK